MSDLQKNFSLQNLCHLPTKNIKSYCGTKHATKDQVKKYKRTMGQWIDDNESVYICEDLAYHLTCYNNLQIIKADEFRKNLGIKNNQSVQNEREVIAAIMKISAKEIMVRQYKINRLPFDVDLCFTFHQLVIEVDENGHIYCDEEKIK